MFRSMLSWLATAPWSGPVALVSLTLAAVVATRICRIAIRQSIRRLARRSSAVARHSGSQAAPGLWRATSTRVDDVSSATGEQRRRQRVEAASRMISHLVSLVIWLIAAIVAFHAFHVDPTFFLSSAGFIGAAVAIGGQHKVNDYLTGLSVHFEDRYGVGDEIVASVGWPEPVQGIVDHVGLFSTRVRDQRSTMHFPNHVLISVRNLSQEAALSTLHVRVPDHVAAADAASLLRGLAGSDGLTDVVFVGDLEGRAHSTGKVAVDIATSRALGERERERLVRRTERALEHDR